MLLFKPGDLIGFSGRGLLAALINLATLAVPGEGISHVGILARPPSGDDTSLPLLFESTSYNKRRCALRDVHVAGLQAQHLDTRTRETRDRLWLYPLAKPLSHMQSLVLTDYCVSNLGASYDMIGALQARDVLCGRILRRFRPESLHRLFCSEFVAAALRHAGRLRTTNASKFSPNRLVRELVRRGVHHGPAEIPWGWPFSRIGLDPPTNSR